MTEAQVTHDYAAQADDELTLKVGEVITGITKSVEGWCEGTLHGRRALFPDNFVRMLPVKTPASEKSIAAPRGVARGPSTGAAAGGAGVSELRNRLGGIIGAAPPPGAAARGLRRPLKRARVTNVYAAQADDELSLEVGAVVDVLRTDCEEGWWEGSVSGGRVGMFPSNFVEVVDDADAERNGDSGGGAAAPEIKGRKVVGVGLGNIFAGGAPIVLRSANRDPTAAPIVSPGGSGAAPMENRASVRVKAPPALPGAKPDTAASAVQPARAKVLFAYAADNEDELTLAEGQVVTVLEQELEDKGWWKGELNGRVGVFPDNFVELLPVADDKPKKPAMPAAAPAGGVPSKPHGDATAAGAGKLPVKREEPKREEPKRVEPKKEEPKPAGQLWGPKVAKMPPTASSTDARSSFETDDQKGRSRLADAAEPAGHTRQPAAQKPPGRPAFPPDAGTKNAELAPGSPPSNVVTSGGGVGGRGGVSTGASSGVSAEQYTELQREVVALREALEQTRRSQDKRFLELMGEIDEEKKTRLNLQVELDRLKKFLTSD